MMDDTKVKSLSIHLYPTGFEASDGTICAIKIVPLVGEPRSMQVGIPLGDNLEDVLDRMYEAVKSALVEQIEKDNGHENTPTNH